MAQFAPALMGRRADRVEHPISIIPGNTSESNGLTEARALLTRFEAEMDGGKGLMHLSEALSLLSDIRAEPASELEKRMASNISLSCLEHVRARVESSFSRESPVRIESIEEWLKVFLAFEAFGFALPQDVAETQSMLLTEKVKREIAVMSAEEKKNLVDRLRGLDI